MKSKLNRISIPVDRSWLSSSILILLVCGAAGGVLSGLSPEMMIAASALALIFWELMQQILNRGKKDGSSTLNHLKSTPFKLLLVSAGTGLLIAEIGLRVHFQLPFGIVILAVLLILYSVYRFYCLMIN
jgi:hypothetical protein